MFICIWSSVNLSFGIKTRTQSYDGDEDMETLASVDLTLS